MVPTSSAVRMITLCFIGYNMVKGEVMTSLDVRRLQTNQTLNYRATYKADFQHLSDFDCSADKPELQVSCFGVNMTILNVSDPSINCTQLEDPVVRNGATYSCVNTCIDCTSVYVASDLPRDGPFASIVFMCEGDDIQYISARYTFDGGTPGVCDATTAANSRNYHVGRLGVSCPLGTSREFVYDDAYVECIFTDSTTGFPLDLTPALSDIDTYTCVTGDNCEGAACTVLFDDMEINTQSQSFIGTCVESLVTSNAIPTPAPQLFTGSTGYKTQYEASWGHFFSSEVSRDACTSANPTVLIKCEAGSSIFYINSTDVLMECVYLSSSELSCSGNIALIRTGFTSVFFTCIGPTASASEVTFPDSSASCSGNFEDVIFSNVVSLGILCESTTSGIFYFHGDFALECADVDNNFDYADQLADSFEFARYVCSESATFGVGSTSSQIIRNVTIGADESWLKNRASCYEIVAVPTAPSVPVANPPTFPPTVTITASPTTATPVEIVSVSPTTSPTRGPIAVTESPSMKNVVTTVAPITGGTTAPAASPGGNGSSVVGIAIGSAVGGVALAAVVAFFLLFSKRKQASSSSTASKPTNESHYTESNTNDDFTSSSRPPTTPQDYMGYSATAALVQPSPVSHQPQPPPLYPVMEVPSNHNNRYPNNEVIEPNNKREVFVPPPDMPVPAVRTSMTRQSATSSSSHRSSYPTNHVVDVKDQCRSVAMVRSSSPTLVSPTAVDTTSTAIPFAVALGVSTTTATTQPSVTSSTSSRTSKKEPGGRIFLDM